MMLIEIALWFVLLGAAGWIVMAACDAHADACEKRHRAERRQVEGR